MNQPTGRDYREYVKIKVLIFLSIIKERSGDEATFHAFEIANRTDTKYDSIRTLLHRWSSKPFLYTLPDGKVIKRKGLRLVKEVDVRRWRFPHHWAYKISKKGERYLQYLKIHHPYYSLAEETVTRLSSDRIYWSDRETGKLFVFVIRPPFDAQDFGQVKMDELPEGQPHPNDGNNWRFARDGIEQAFEAAATVNLNPPSEEFRQYVWKEVERIKREYLKEHPIFPSAKPTSQPPTVRKDDVNQYGIPKFIHINPANLDAAMKELEEMRKQSPKQEP